MFYNERSPFSQKDCNDGASELNIEFTLMFYNERSPFSQRSCKGTTFLTNNYKKQSHFTQNLHKHTPKVQFPADTRIL
jgi:hypothetical protein